MITGVGVAEVLGTDHVEELVLSDGRRLETTEVVLALGVIPAVDWLADSGLEIDNGIVCSAAGRASLPHVYAVGDAARWWHPLANEHRRIEHWTSAGEQARVVAANIVAGPDGPETELAKVPYFWSDQHGVMIQAFGFIGDGAESQVIKVKDRTVVLYSRRGRLVGALGFSAPRPLMRLRALIANRAPVADAVTLLQPEFANAEGVTGGR
jgi:3-phenylpropionate/trans-cinnamate dioxygenase ferredoxin reductase subunit